VVLCYSLHFLSSFEKMSPSQLVSGLGVDPTPSKETVAIHCGFLLPALFVVLGKNEVG
jgi:hypothetical protein